MSEPGANKRKHKTIHSLISKKEKIEETDFKSSAPCHKRPESPESDNFSPIKKRKIDALMHNNEQVLSKKIAPVSGGKGHLSSVMTRSTSVGSRYSQLCWFSRKPKENPQCVRSSIGSSSKSSCHGDVQSKKETPEPRKDKGSQQLANLTGRTRKKKHKSRNKEESEAEQAPTTDAKKQVPHKLATWINSFKIVTLPKESTNSIAARSQAFQKACKKRMSIKKCDRATSSSQHLMPKQLPSVKQKEKNTCLEKAKCLLDSATQSLDMKTKTDGLSTPLQDAEDSEEEMQIVEELHTARSEKKLDLDVAQTCGELTSMDIDSSEGDVHNCPVNMSCSNVLIVLDTNIMIGHLDFIKALKTMELPGFGKPVLIIPWVVLQELDYMKNGKLLQTVKHKAIPAVQFIYVCLKKQDPQLWGQSMQQASQKMYGLTAENNDDRVLHCCIQFQKLYPNAKILLCTDDKNLCNKAIVSDVKAVSKADLLAAIHNLMMTTSGQPSGAITTLLRGGQVSKNDNSCENSSSDASNPFRTVVSDLEKCLGLALSKILETEMKIAFEDLWVEVLFLKPPWTLSDLLQCFKKHWLAVFGMVVKRDLLESIDFLHENMCKGATVDYLLMGLLLKQSSILLNGFSSRANYDGALPEACARIGQLLKTVSEVNNVCLQNSSKSKEILPEKSVLEKCELEGLRMAYEEKSSETQNIQNNERFREIWTVLESLCNTVAKYSDDVFNTFTDVQALLLVQPTASLLPLQETFVCLQKLMMAVKNILAGIQRTLEVNSSSEDIWPLYQVLVNNEIHVTDFKFSAVELYECLSQSEYRQKLTIGYSQLGVLENKMKTLNESICLEAKSRGWM
ncbi:transcriptional protein SWT1 isoform X2 [Ambystoma mexicanum]|uniref:transcriptional protein SWT1 isoform X2 n=1 Tax=Ambystoma mexicanum TaxID=8296 RepID=UPI0037E872A2